MASTAGIFYGLFWDTTVACVQSFLLRYLREISSLKHFEIMLIKEGTVQRNICESQDLSRREVQFTDASTIIMLTFHSSTIGSLNS